MQQIQRIRGERAGFWLPSTFTGRSSQAYHDALVEVAAELVGPRSVGG
ncbi:hypothetical protein ACIA58_33300 [Kribbella sp. NPDC051586]